MTSILAIDPATKCGYANLRFTPGCVALRCDNFKDIVSGTMNLTPKRHEGGGMRYLRFRQQLIEMITATSPSMLAYEEVRRHMGVDAAHVYGALEGVIMAVCDEIGLPYGAYPVGTIKKVATGKGNAGKDEMIAAAVREWPDFDGDDNAADARWIAVTAAQQMYAVVNKTEKANRPEGVGV